MLGWWFLNLNLARDCDQFSMLSSWKSRHLPCSLWLATLNYISTDFLCLGIICVMLVLKGNVHASWCGFLFFWGSCCGFLVGLSVKLLVSIVMFGFRARQMKRLKGTGVYDFFILSWCLWRFVDILPVILLLSVGWTLSLGLIESACLFSCTDNLYWIYNFRVHNPFQTPCCIAKPSYGYCDVKVRSHVDAV